MTRCDDNRGGISPAVYLRSAFSLLFLTYQHITMHFNNAKILTAFAFTGTIASVASAGNISRGGDEKDLENKHQIHGKGTNSKNDDNHGKYDEQDKLSHEEALKKHSEEVEKQIKLNNEAAKKNRVDVKVGCSDV